MAARIVYWHPGSRSQACVPCPFRGVRVEETPEAFRSFLRDRIINSCKDAEGRKYTPAIVFHTADRSKEILFSGSRMSLNGAPTNPVTGRPYKWELVNDENGVLSYFSLSRDEDVMKLMSLFPNAEEETKKQESFFALALALSR